MVRQSALRAGTLLAATALAGSLAASHPAAAQDASQLQAIQRQISQLQAQLRRLQHEAASRDAALRRAQEDAAQARVQAAQAMQRAQAAPSAAAYPQPGPYPPGAYPPGAYPPGTYAQGPAPAVVGGFSLGTPNPNASSLASASPASVTTTSVDQNNPTFRLGGVTVTLGGFLDTTAIYRSRNLTSGTSSSFAGIPYPNSPNGHVDEFRMTAQPSRFSLLVQGRPGPQTNLAGYVELDLNSAATTANSVQTNSYNPRIRLAYGQYDDTADGLHVLAGQNWSLATGSLVGITPRKESLPPVIDANYLPGFVYTRGPQVRVVKDFGGEFWLGASVEAPQEVYSFAGLSGASTPAGTGVLPPQGNQKVGDTITFGNPGGSYLNSTASYSYDTAPDIVIKAAADPGFGHYEAYGLGRFFKARTSEIGAGDTRTVFGGGIGGSTVIPIMPHYVDFIGDVLAGYGVGRYGAGQLPDATFKANGAPAPLPEIIGMAGVVGHPIKAVDLYTFVGTEQIGRSDFTTGTGAKTAGYGYGTPYISTAGCETELLTCSAQTRALDDVSVGGWWRFLHGGFGTVQAGAEVQLRQEDRLQGQRRPPHHGRQHRVLQPALPAVPVASATSGRRAGCGPASGSMSCSRRRSAVVRPLASIETASAKRWPNRMSSGP